MLWSLLFISLIGSAHLDTQSCHTQITVQNGLTSQSTSYSDEDNVTYVSKRAVDGKKEECAHTLKQNNSWWTIDLLGVYNICCISIYTKKQDNIHMTGAQIYIGNSRKNNGTTNKLYKTITEFPTGTYNNFESDTAVSGRYVTVFLPGENILALCEVKINGTRRDSPFVLIEKKKTWEDALYYCRDNYRDLASILNKETQAWAELEARKASTPFVWLGLHYTCTLEFWFWVDDQHLDFNHWAPKGKTETCDRSAAMEKNEDHLWFSMSDYVTFNFICAKY